MAFKRVCDSEAKFKRNGTVASFCFLVSSSRLTLSSKLHYRNYYKFINLYRDFFINIYNNVCNRAIGSDVNDT